ncbi:MAG TPA: FAD-dependent oxidoreductase [Cyclobacteriaceae bacterium]|nr:FAD-dependent oxidoreductase [Cyclobacteriaceae bacterium]
MKLRSKETYWLLKNGLINCFPSLTENISCDILIIGGGITGSLMAYQLSKEGYDTVAIDKRDIGMGSTAATTAMLQYEIDEPLHSLINKVGETAAIESYKQGVIAIEELACIIKELKIECGFERKNSLYFAVTNSELKWLKEEFSVRQKYGLKVTWLSEQTLKAEYHVLGRGGILSENGATVDAYKLTHDLLSSSQKKYGLRIYDHTSADKTVYKKQRHNVYTDGKCVIQCQHIVYASGYETESMFKEKIVDLNSTYALISEPLTTLPAMFNKTIFWNTEDPYLYLRSTPDNRIIVGGGDVAFKNTIRRDRLIEKKEDFLLKKVHDYFPDLSIISDFSWAGTFGVTKDALPYIGSHPNYPGAYFVLGFGGNGITFSIIGMKIISDALAGRANRFLEYFKFNR